MELWSINNRYSNFICGVITAGEYFGKEVKNKANILYKRINWEWYKNKENNLFYMGYKPEKGFWGQWNGYAEQLIMYILGVSSPTYPIDKSMYYEFNRKKKDYKDARKVYNDLFAWEVKIFFNTSKSDIKTSVKSISKFKSAYCHVILSGGAPGDSTKLRYVMNSPGGGVTSETWSKIWKNGTSGGTVYWSDVAQYAPSGVLSVAVYDVNTGKKLGSASIDITN